MNFNFDIIDYVITRKHFDVTKTKNIIDRMQDVFIYIREKINKVQLIMIEQINRYKKNVIFKKKNLVFLNIKNIIINKLFKKLNDKIFDSFKIIFVIDSFYKLKLSDIIKIYNVFHFKLLILVVINSLSDQKIFFLKLPLLKIKRNE